MDKREVRKLSQMFNPQTRPAHIPTSRRVKWRLVKKWFNRYEKTDANRQNRYSCFKNRRTNSYAYNRCENRKSWRTPA